MFLEIQMMNDVYKTEFKNMEKEPIGKKIMYKNGVPVKENYNINNNMIMGMNYNQNVLQGNNLKKIEKQNFHSGNNGGTDYYNKNYKSSNK